MLNEPPKKSVWFEESAYEPPAEEPAKFNALMAELALPCVEAAARIDLSPVATRGLEAG